MSQTNAWGTALAQTNGFVYDGAGNLLISLDPLGRGTTNIYAALGRVVAVRGADGRQRLTGYDTLGRQVAETNEAGVVSRLGYDGLGRLTGVTNAWGEPEQSWATYAYDQAGNQIRQTDALGRVTRFEYDALGRRLRRTLPLGQSEHFAYDAGGCLLQHSNFLGLVLTNAYDGLGRLTGRFAGSTNLESWAYSPSGQKIGMTNAAGSFALGYDLRDRLLTKSGPAGALTYKYDAAGHLTNLYSATASGVSLYYRYDAVGNRTNRTSSLSGVGATNNYFDANDWLDTDSLTNNGSAWFDAAGNTRTNGATPYQYDWANRLTNAGAGAVVLAYDPDGNRVKKVAGGVTTLYLVDDRNPSGYAQVLEERTVSGSTTNLARQYTYGLDLISQRAPNVATNFYGYDGQGSARFLLNPAGAVTDTYAYDAYGSLLAATGATTNYYRYTGEQWDPELRLYYLRARYYQPNAGRSQARPPQASLDAPSRPASFGARGSRLSASPARWPTGFPAEFHFPVTAGHVWSSWVIRKDFGARAAYIYGIDFKNQWDKDISNEAHSVRRDATRGGSVRRPG